MSLVNNENIIIIIIIIIRYFGYDFKIVSVAKLSIEKLALNITMEYRCNRNRFYF